MCHVPKPGDISLKITDMCHVSGVKYLFRNKIIYILGYDDKMLEEMIKSRPELYLWSHNRFKHAIELKEE